MEKMRGTSDSSSEKQDCEKSVTTTTVASKSPSKKGELQAKHPVHHELGNLKLQDCLADLGHVRDRLD